MLVVKGMKEGERGEIEKSMTTKKRRKERNKSPTAFLVAQMASALDLGLSTS